MGERLRIATVAWLSMIGLGVVVLAVTAVVGWLLPPERAVARSVVIAQPPAAVWAVLADPTTEPTWNAAVASIAPLAEPPPTWDADGDGGHRLLRDLLRLPPQRLVRARVRDDGNGERWTFVLTPAGSGTRVTLTTRAAIPSPLARCWARLGADGRAVERALAGLARRFDQSAAIDDAQPDDEEAHAEPPEAVPVR